MLAHVLTDVDLVVVPAVEAVVVIVQPHAQQHVEVHALFHVVGIVREDVLLHVLMVVMDVLVVVEHRVVGTV